MNEPAFRIGVAVAAALFLLAAAWFTAARISRSRRRNEGAYVEGLEAAAFGDTQRAIRLLREAVEDDTDNVDAYLHLGRLLRMRGDTERALRIHRELAIRRLSQPQRGKVLGEVLADLVQAGRWTEAKDVARDVRGLGQVSPALLRDIGKIQENLREWDAAIATFDELEKRRANPSKRRLGLYRAFVALEFERRDKLKDAKRHYEAALKLAPSLPGALLHLGDIHHREGDLTKAIDCWKQLIRDNPNAVSRVFDRLEKTTYERDPGRITELAAEYERILAESPDDVSTMHALASLHRRRGDTEECLRVLEHAIERQPESPRLHIARARVLVEMGRPEEAFDEMRTVLKADGKGERGTFICSQCGYRAEEYLWRCPSCERWETFEE